VTDAARKKAEQAVKAAQRDFDRKTTKATLHVARSLKKRRKPA
jgi:hypothetical protein